VAAWIATLDGAASVRTQDALTQLASALGVPESPRQRADEILREIAGEDNRPDRFDVRGLRETLDQRLDAARAARLAQLNDEG
jgi:hypothetical protein